MITLDALLVLIAAASLPVTYILLCSRWIEPEDRKTRAGADAALAKPAAQPKKLVQKAA